jgi:hypothetical protein
MKRDQVPKHFMSALRLPKVAFLKDGMPVDLYGTYVLRIRDCTMIINAIIDQWEIFQTGIEGEPWSDELEDQIRLKTIDATFSLITFFLLLRGFHRGICSRIAEAMDEYALDANALREFPWEDDPIVADLQVVRNKMVAHTAAVEGPPRHLPQDRSATKWAYLQWYVGHHGRREDYRNRRLNIFSATSGEREEDKSDHVALPVFAEIIEASLAYVSRCEDCCHANAGALSQSIRRARGRDL